MALGITKVGNEYADAVMGIDAPKAVWMAIAVSFAIQNMGSIDNPNCDNLRAYILNEWSILHDNGIVPQKPYRVGRRHKTRFD